MLLISKNEYTPFIQRVTCAASINLTLSSIALLIFMNYPVALGTSSALAITSIGGASFITLLINCGLIHFPKNRHSLLVFKKYQSPFDCVPTEILSHILSLLSPKELVVCSLICRSWRTIAEDDYLWRKIYSKSFGEELNLDLPLNWKKAFFLFPAFFKEIYEHQYEKHQNAQLLRYNEWNFTIENDAIRRWKQGFDTKSYSFEGSSHFPLKRINIVKGSIFGIRQNYTIDEWSCDTGELIRTIKTSIFKKHKKNEHFFRELRTPYPMFEFDQNWSKIDFLMNSQWLVFRHPKTISNHHTYEFIRYKEKNLKSICYTIKMRRLYSVAIHNNTFYIQGAHVIKRLDLINQTKLTPMRIDDPISSFNSMNFTENKIYIGISSSVNVTTCGIVYSWGSVSQLDLDSGAQQRKFIFCSPHTNSGGFYVEILHEHLVVFCKSPEDLQNFTIKIFNLNSDMLVHSIDHVLDRKAEEMNDEAKRELLITCFSKG